LLTEQLQRRIHKCRGLGPVTQTLSPFVVGYPNPLNYGMFDESEIVMRGPLSFSVEIEWQSASQRCALLFRGRAYYVINNFEQPTSQIASPV
jgi:hypothetical protein